MTVAEVIARTLFDLQVKVVTHVPGHGGTQTFDALNRIAPHQPMSFHEEVAYTISHGAALAGVRSACLVKTHGIAKAINSVLDSLSCGTTAGFVTILFADPTGKHSDNIFEIEPILYGAKVPYHRSTPSTIQLDLVRAYTDSQFDSLPYFIVIDADSIDQELTYEPFDLPPQPEAYERDIVKHLVTPLFAQYQYDLLNSKIDQAPVPERPTHRTLQEALPPVYLKAVEPYIPIFEAFNEHVTSDFVSGDAGVSTLSAFSPYDIVNAASYLGGSLPLAMGAYLAGMKHSWAFTGDFSFIGAGHLGLIEAVERSIPLKVLIYANGTAQTTGGQPLDLSHLGRLLKGYEQYVLHIPDVNDRATVASVLSEASKSNSLQIVVATFNKSSK